MSLCAAQFVVVLDGTIAAVARHARCTRAADLP
jgi:hypothetical protein